MSVIYSNSYLFATFLNWGFGNTAFYKQIMREMKEYEFLLNIDNKEILIEILNHSIDFLIGNQDEQQTMRMSHKYGFLSPDDFLLTTRSIAKFYRNACLSETEIDDNLDLANSEFSNLTAEFQRIIVSVLQSRRHEVISYLIREQNAFDCPLVESFDWDTRLVLGDSSYAQYRKLLTALILNLNCGQNSKKQLYVEMDYKKLNELIETIESALENAK